MIVSWYSHSSRGTQDPTVVSNGFARVSRVRLPIQDCPGGRCCSGQNEPAGVLYLTGVYSMSSPVRKNFRAISLYILSLLSREVSLGSRRPPTQRRGRGPQTNPRGRWRSKGALQGCGFFLPAIHIVCCATPKRCSCKLITLGTYLAIFGRTSVQEQTGLCQAFGPTERLLSGWSSRPWW